MKMDVNKMVKMWVLSALSLCYVCCKIPHNPFPGLSWNMSLTPILIEDLFTGSLAGTIIVVSAIQALTTSAGSG